MILGYVLIVTQKLTLAKMINIPSELKFTLIFPKLRFRLE